MSQVRGDLFVGPRPPLCKFHAFFVLLSGAFYLNGSLLLLVQEDNALELHGWCSTEDQSLFKSCKLLLEQRDEHVKWLEFCPQYGCVILGFTAAEQPPSGVVNVEVLGLDKPEFTLHGNFSNGKAKYDHFMKFSGNFVSLFAGRAEESELGGLKAKFHNGLGNHGQSRYANQQRRHPYSPDHVHAVMKHALGGEAAQALNAGFTDFATGNPGNTALALVLSLLQWVSTQRGMLVTYEKLMIHADLRLADMVLENVKNSGQCDGVPVRTQLDWANCIVEAAARKIARQFASKVEVSDLQQKATKLRDTIRQTTYELQDAEGRALQLSNIKEELSRPGAFQSFTVALPKEVKLDKKQDTVAIRKTAAINIGLVPTLNNPRVFDPNELDSWIRSPRLQADKRLEDALLIVATVEEVFWRRVERGLDEDVMNMNHLKILAGVVEQYQRVICLVRMKLRGDHYMKTEIFSRELLVVWIFYCLAFKCVRKLYNPLLDHVGVALRYQDLEHLVLSNKRLCSVLLGVMSFLQHNYVPEKELFSLRHHSTMFEFGVNFTDRYLSDIFEQEKANAKARVANHWEEVLSKKKKAAILESEIHALRLQVAAAQNALAVANAELQLAEAKHNQTKRSLGSAITRQAVRKATEIARSKLQTVNSLNQSVTSKEVALKNVKKAPAPVVQPLPQSSEMMKQWIFFLHMPEPLRLVGDLTFFAQQLLVPSLQYGNIDGVAVSTVESLLVSLPALSVISHYNSMQSSCYFPAGPRYQATQGVLRLHTESDKIPNFIGLQTIDEIHFEEQGVWYPDIWRVRMAWVGSRHAYQSYSGKELDPFRVKRATTALYFTEQIDASIQWSIKQDGEPSRDRGNLALARQSQRPQGLSRIAFLLHSSLRAFPYKQIRNVVLSFLNPSFPHEDLNLQKMMLQAIFQVGALGASCKSDRTLKWKCDLFDKTFCTSVNSVFDDLEKDLHFSPARCNSAILLGEVSAYFSSWDEPLKSISRRIARAAVRWADDVAKQMQTTGSSPGDALVGKQCRFLYQAVLCLAKGQVDDVDLCLLIPLTSRCHNLHVGLTGLAVDDAIELDRYRSRCLETLASVVDMLVDAVRRHKKLLTEALNEVIIAPTGLSWRPFLLEGMKASTCFEAVGRDKCLYTINVLTGAVLVNGSPPSSLPQAIQQHPLFKRTFGRNFLRVVPKLGYYETATDFGGRLYHFSLDGDDLHVTELDIKCGRLMELIDADTSTAWGSELPTRLRDLHSHWFCREKNYVVFRGKMFNEREIDFVLLAKNNITQDSASVSCRCVPEHLRLSELSTILKSKDTFGELVKHESSVTGTLEKVEDRDFIHVIRQQNDILFHLPRFRLTFSYSYGDEIRCRDFPDFCLAKEQLLKALWGFRGYLVLDRSACLQSEGRCVIFPDGRIDKNGGTITVRRNMECSADIGWHRIYVHERVQFPFATDSVARLQLAALHVATNHMVADRMTGVRGEERAMELLRQCWTPAPLSSRERSILTDILDLSAGRLSNLILVCIDILQAAEQTAFLYASTGHADILDYDYVDEVVAYQRLRKRFCRNNRLLLTHEEMTRVTGCAVSELEGIMPFSQQGIADCCAPVSDEFATLVEADLKNLTSGTGRILRSKKIQQFPMVLPESGGALESSILMELKSSWTLDKERAPLKHKLCNDWSVKLDEIGMKVKSKRLEMELYLLNVLNADGGHFVGFEAKMISALRLSNELPTASIADLVRASYNPDLIVNFNPLLPGTDIQKLTQELVRWLCLCRLEDKLARLDLCRACNDLDALTMELRLTCTFDANSYPEWAAFEVESRLQIRPEQYLVAKHLLENPGNLIQLNMGCGKTRVILPMLVLHLSLPRREYQHITRLTILTALFKENYSFFREQLTGSLACVKVYLMPFCREIELCDRRVQALLTLVHQCRRERGIMMVAPEHRLSLNLKLKEMLGSENLARSCMSQKLQYLCGGIWRDILDECDELLHHRFQLIYACGNVEGLPSGPIRFRAAQALINSFFFHEDVTKFLISHQNVFVGAADLKSKSEKFPSIRVNAQTAPEPLIREFRSVLAEAMLADPPYEFQWLHRHALEAHLMAAMIDPCASLKFMEGLPLSNQNDILALRGLLAGDILWHCLQKRHRVDFGIARPGKKRICVPFRGADTPSLRSEFSHPEVAITLTLMAYYSDGLDEKEIRQAFRELLKLGPVAKQSYYSQWYELSKQRLRIESPEMEAAVDTVEKLDPTNPYQFKILVEYFRSNMLTINFWLNTCVFPEEMQHHPWRLTANSWHLANNPSVGTIGFSGTNDNHRILPLQVTQYFISDFSNLDSHSSQFWMEMMGTNGRMVDVILNNVINCIELTPGNVLTTISDLLLQGRTVHAIIDAGALFVGTSNREIASKILQIMVTGANHVSAFDGVVFYENRPGEVEGWMIIERSGRVFQKELSPVTESRAFAFFDERRCRGSDLKLAKDAVALLTLGPKMRKDTFMQAAGRMRKLGNQQKLILVAVSDVANEIRGTGSLNFNVKNILYWTIRNTVRMNEDGLMPWTSQGLFFASTDEKPELSMQDDDCSLQRLYNAPFAKETMAKAALLVKEGYMARVGDASSMSARNSKMVDDIMQRSNELGTHSVCTVLGTDEECERELELEREVEEEEEMEIPQLKPLLEVDWDLNSVFATVSPTALPAEAGVHSLASFVNQRLTPKTLSRIQWSGKVFGTHNFFQSVQHASGATVTSLNYYLRPIDVIIRFPSGEILLVSDREADELLKLFWDRRRTNAVPPEASSFMNSFWSRGERRVINSQQVDFLHFSVVRTASDGRIADLTRRSMALTSTGDVQDIMPISDDIIAEIQLFAGETTYGNETRKAALRAMLRGTENVSACGEPEHVVEMRGLSETLPFSDLEKICSSIAKEVGEAFATGGMRQSMA